MQSTLTDLRQNTNQLGDSTGTKDERLARLDKIDKDITDLDGKLAEFQSIDPSIIVSPFRSETKSVANVQPSISDFFAPAVLALLLQHLAVTFAALSIVRERNVGTMELFRVSPLSAAEALFGKYISYMLFGGVIAAILSALLVFALHVPMLGNWWYFALVIAAVLFTSLGIGFAISIVSQTDSQAVQYSMIILLASVFFSGFIMSLDMLWEPVRVISWLLPTTYGTLLLRDIALRGIDPNWAAAGWPDRHRPGSDAHILAANAPSDCIVTMILVREVLMRQRFEARRTEGRSIHQISYNIGCKGCPEGQPFCCVRPSVCADDSTAPFC